MKKGVLTVEASVIVPLCFVMTALLIGLLFFEHNRVYYSAAACEAAVTGNFWYPREEGGEEAARTSAEERIQEVPVPGQTPDISADKSLTGMKVSFSRRTSRFMGYEWTGYRTEAEAVRVKQIGRAHV